MLGLWHSPCPYGHPSCFLQPCTQRHRQGQPDRLYSDTPNQDSAATEEVKWERNHQRPLAEGAISAHRELPHKRTAENKPTSSMPAFEIRKKVRSQGKPMEEQAENLRAYSTEPAGWPRGKSPSSEFLCPYICHQESYRPPGDQLKQDRCLKQPHNL